LIRSALPGVMESPHSTDGCGSPIQPRSALIASSPRNFVDSDGDHLCVPVGAPIRATAVRRPFLGPTVGLGDALGLLGALGSCSPQMAILGRQAVLSLLHTCRAVVVLTALIGRNDV
jgi:hypothetical protein